jgi:hypothetical protein
MIPIPRDFREFLSLLNRHRVKYLVIGGYAVGYHGYPRYTGDIDIFVATSPENGKGLVKVFREFGFADDHLAPEFFCDYGQVIRLGREPMKLEIVNKIDGVTFAECYARRERARLEDLRVNFIAYEDLLKNKRASGRHKDLQDLEVLQTKPGRKRSPIRR